ncbi:sedoheptulose 7-phosphate cyclase [Martelella alba]|nr:sedoheptulose 7-phosphate cyclase [Martelella alba]
MKTIEINAKQDVIYNVELYKSLDEVLSVLAGNYSDNGSLNVFIDNGLPKTHVNAVMDGLRASGINAQSYDIPSGEEEKTLDNAIHITDLLNQSGTKRRSSPPIVLGGGVSCDLVGFACSIYRRGIPFIRIPTTLLGMVDVSVAAKTAVNHFGFRNRLGSFHPARLTLLYPGFLSTLPVRHISNGLAEVFKIALIKSNYLLDLLDKHGEKFFDSNFQSDSHIMEIIYLAADLMAEELSPNLWEHNLKRIVDYGHSFSPLIEMTYIDELLHGEAVAIDCLYSAILSQQRNMLDDSQVKKLFDIAKKLRLPLYHRGFSDDKLILSALKDTKIHRDGNQNLPLMCSLGQAVFINDLTEQEMRSASKLLRDFSESVSITQ